MGCCVHILAFKLSITLFSSLCHLISISTCLTPAPHLQPIWCVPASPSPLHVSSPSGQLVSQDALSQAALLGRSSMGGAWVETESTDWTLSLRTGALAGHPPSASDGRGRWESQNQPHLSARLCYWRYKIKRCRVFKISNVILVWMNGIALTILKHQTITGDINHSWKQNVFYFVWLLPFLQGYPRFYFPH